MRIPVVGIVDTNSDPTGIQYAVPGNDDALKSVRLLCQQVREAIESGLEEKALRKVEKTDVQSDQVLSTEDASGAPAKVKAERAPQRARREDDNSDSTRGFKPIKI